jgi:ACS family hexuronate transporter-like MFS transporter
VENKNIFTRYRWRICALLFFATTINYVDRNVLSFTMIDEVFRKEMLDITYDGPLSKEDTDQFKKMFGYVDAMFKFAYAMGFILFGYVIDRIGTKKGFAISISVWSLAGILNAFVGSFKGLGFTRSLLGLGEAGNFPSSVKTVAEWFPKKERALAAGIFNAGANVGVIATAIAVPWITITYGWRTSFIITGALGIILLFFWWRMYSKPQGHPKVNSAELNHIESDQDNSNKKISWTKLFSYKQTWAFAVGKFLTDPIWYFYLTWLPDFFNSNDALDMKLKLSGGEIGAPFVIIYLVSDLGSVFFGWLSSKMIANGSSVNKARKITMMICAFCVVPIVFASTTNSLYVAVALIALATAAHQGWSANLLTLTSDMFPRQVIASVVGIGGMMGALGGALFAASTGVIRVNFGYMPLFIIAGSAYLIGIVLIHVIVPKLGRIEVED